MKLSKKGLGQTATGQIVNLLANDVSRFDMIAGLFHVMWASILVFIIISFLLYRQIGNSAFYGIVFVLFVCTLQCK
jgi:ATP-binding cassette, subfamily C (CFTR/MRP), member 4